MLQRHSIIGPRRDILQLGVAGILCGWALQGYLMIEHYKDILRVGNIMITLRLGTARILGVGILQGYSAIGHCRDT